MEKNNGARKTHFAWIYFAREEKNDYLKIKILCVSGAFLCLDYLRHAAKLD